MQILDSEKNVVEEWESTEEPHYMEKLAKGDYVLHEETAPLGYVKAEDIPFTVEDTGKIQKVVMKDAETAPGTRIKAAQILLDICLRTSEQLDILSRIENLERILAEGNDGTDVEIENDEM